MAQLNHKLVAIKPDVYMCRVCSVSWSYLNDADVIMLTTRGKCLGEKEVWRRCKAYKDMRCRGPRQSPLHKDCG